MLIIQSPGESMKKLSMLGLAVLLAVGMAFGPSKANAATRTFVGSIGDSMCGLKHTMGGNDKDCTLDCVKKEGSKYVLVDAAAAKVYGLSDQKKPEQFAGQKVKVTGSLKGNTITVVSIVAAQ
jgi:hypothetical protein